ncbi:MAG: hypothetical protein ABR587_13920 [Candidatus Binatia bacterium]
MALPTSDESDDPNLTVHTYHETLALQLVKRLPERAGELRT